MENENTTLEQLLKENLHLKNENERLRRENEHIKALFHNGITDENQAMENQFRK